MGRLKERIELNGRVLRIKQPVQLGPAGLHAPGHFAFGDLSGFHGLENLGGQNPLHRAGGDIFVKSLFLPYQNGQRFGLAGLEKEGRGNGRSLCRGVPAGGQHGHFNAVTLAARYKQ